MFVIKGFPGFTLLECLAIIFSHWYSEVWTLIEINLLHSLLILLSVF